MTIKINIAVADLELDSGTQSRVGLRQDRIDEYAQLMQDGEEFPLVVVFTDGVSKWVADGFHRVHAAKKNGAFHIACDLRNGTKADCIRYAVGANKEHDHAGLRRTNADKRHAVEMYLTLIWSEGKDESDRIVSDICGVDKTLVMRARDELVQNTTSLKPPSHRLGKDGKMHPAHKERAPEAPEPEPKPSRISRPKSEAVAELDEKVKALLEQGLGTGGIAEMLGCDPHKVSTSKQRLGMTRRTSGNPLMGLTEQASEHAGSWEFAADTLKHRLGSATQQQRDALLDELKGLMRAVKGLVSVLAKSEGREIESC